MWVSPEVCMVNKAAVTHQREVVILRAGTHVTCASWLDEAQCALPTLVIGTRVDPVLLQRLLSVRVVNLKQCNSSQYSMLPGEVSSCCKIEKLLWASAYWTLCETNHCHVSWQFNRLSSINMVIYLFYFYKYDGSTNTLDILQKV